MSDNCDMSTCVVFTFRVLQTNPTLFLLKEYSRTCVRYSFAGKLAVCIMMVFSEITN